MRKRSFHRHPLAVPSWAGGQLCVVNYRTRQAVALTPTLSRVLDYLSEWRSLDDIVREYALDKGDAGRLIAGLRINGLVEQRTGRTKPTGGQAAWDEWGPLAAAFHFGTRDTHFPKDSVLAERNFLEQKAGQRPPGPSRRKGQRTALRRALPTKIGDQLKARRTWRNFGSQPVACEQLSTLLSLTFGVTAFADGSDGHRVALKTSPSGGARHPIEAYIAINGVRSVPAGLYHFDSWSGHLTLIKQGMSRAKLRSYMPSQPWFWRAQIVVFMTAVFARTSWRYPAARAYRNILIEAGHLAQSFCLLATELDLAPFTTHAIADSKVDDDLGLDGVKEGVVYVVGCGSQPPGGWTTDIPGLTLEGQ